VYVCVRGCALVCVVAVPSVCVVCGFYVWYVVVALSCACCLFNAGCCVCYEL